MSMQDNIDPEQLSFLKVKLTVKQKSALVERYRYVIEALADFSVEHSDYFQRVLKLYPFHKVERVVVKQGDLQGLEAYLMEHLGDL